MLLKTFFTVQVLDNPPLSSQMMDMFGNKHANKQHWY